MEWVLAGHIAAGLFAAMATIAAGQAPPPVRPTDGPAIEARTPLGPISVGAGGVATDERTGVTTADLEVGYVLRDRVGAVVPLVYEVRPLLINRVQASDQAVLLSSGVGGGARLSLRREGDPVRLFIKGTIVQPSDYGARIDRTVDAIMTLGAGLEIELGDAPLGRGLERVRPPDTTIIQVALPAGSLAATAPDSAAAVDLRARTMTAYVRAVLAESRRRGPARVGAQRAAVVVPPAREADLSALTLMERDLALALPSRERDLIARTRAPDAPSARAEVVRRRLGAWLAESMRGPYPLAVLAPDGHGLRIITVRPGAGGPGGEAAMFDADRMIDDFLAQL